MSGATSVLDRFRLDDKTAIVTGIGPGIGSHVARAYAQAGARVVLAARTQERLDELATSIKSEGGNALAVRCDVAVDADLERLVQISEAEYGSVDILFNNAYASDSSVTGDSADAIADTGDDWLSCLAANLIAPQRLAQLLVPSMKRRGNGSIINVLTTAAFNVLTPPRLAYACTKAGLAMMTRYQAREYSPEVRVNALCPGTTTPDGVAPNAQAFIDVLPLVPMRRAGRAEEFIGAALFLASDASSYTTGQITFVDGGRVNTVGGKPLS